MAEFGQGVNKSTAQLLQGTNISTTQLQTWGKAIAAGGDQGAKAMDEVGKALLGIQDKTKQNAVGVAFFGTQFEDNGTKIMDALGGASDAAGNLDQNVKQVGEDTNKMNADPTVQLNKALTDMNTALTPLMTSIANFVGSIATWVSENPQLAATITAVVVAVGILIGILAALSVVLGVLTGAATALGFATAPITIWFWIIVAAIAAAIAIGILLYRNWDTIRNKASELVANIKVQWEAFKAATETKFNAAKEKIMSIWNGVMNFFKGIDLAKIGKDIIQGLINGIGSMAQKAWDKAKSIAEGIGTAISKAVGRKSPAKMTIEIGEDVGAGLEIGLDNSRGKINDASNRMAQAALPKIPTNNIQNQNVGGKSLTVNINSPKALDVREANREFNRTFNRMALQW